MVFAPAPGTGLLEALEFTVFGALTRWLLRWSVGGGARHFRTGAGGQKEQAMMRALKLLAPSPRFQEQRELEIEFHYP